EFSPSLLKMRSVDSKYFPKNLLSYHSSHSLNDIVLTKEIINRQWSDFVNSKRFRIAKYRYPNSTSQGAGRLLINMKADKGEKNVPLNILLFRYDNHEFLRVYPGNTTLVHELKKGYYKLIFFYAGAQYHIEDSLYVQPNGLNYYEFSQPSF